MATFKIHDRADEFRVDIIGRFAGGCVQEVRLAWREALSKTLSRVFTVTLTRVSGFDGDGRMLLREMQQHGTQFAAGTPEALMLLEDISAPIRRGPILVQDLPPQEVPANRKPSESEPRNQARSKASSR